MAERGEEDGAEYLSNDEGQEDYKEGGYHPVSIGDGFKNNRYIVQSKLGWGHFSTVWLSWDNLEDRYVAVKVQKSAENYTDAAQDEFRFLKEIRQGDPEDKKCVVKLLDHFWVNGPNGEHFCLVFEFLGDNLLTLIKYNGCKGLPLTMVKEICYYILKGLDYIHRELSIIHTDLKPENIVLVSPIDPAKDPYKNGQYPSNKSSKKFNQNSNFIKDTERVNHSSEAPNETLDSAEESSNSECPMDPLNFMGHNKPSVFASPNVNTEGLSKNQKKKLEKKAKKLALDPASSASSSKYSGLVSQGMEGKKANCSTKEHMCEGVDEKDDFVKENVANVTPLKEMKLSLRRKILANIDVRCKIADFGCACWAYRHFSGDIQTRQYRAPEVIIGDDYCTSVDMWSFACIAFELATGEVLFHPYAGHNHNKKEDHLALMKLYLGPIPKRVALGGSRSCELFNRNGELRNVRPCFRPLRSVLRWQYNFTEQEANEFADFLVPLLNFIPEDRPTAAQWLQHPWLNGVSSQKSNSHVDRARTVQQVSTKPQHKTGNRMTRGKDIWKAENLVSKDGGDKIILLPWKENI